MRRPPTVAVSEPELDGAVEADGVGGLLPGPAETHPENACAPTEEVETDEMQEIPEGASAKTPEAQRGEAVGPVLRAVADNPQGSSNVYLPATVQDLRSRFRAFNQLFQLRQKGLEYTHAPHPAWSGPVYLFPELH
jgi:hypothetical protein